MTQWVCNLCLFSLGGFENRAKAEWMLVFVFVGVLLVCLFGFCLREHRLCPHITIHNKRPLTLRKMQAAIAITPGLGNVFLPYLGEAVSEKQGSSMEFCYL